MIKKEGEGEGVGEREENERKRATETEGGREEGRKGGREGECGKRIERRNSGSDTQGNRVNHSEGKSILLVLVRISLLRAYLIAVHGSLFRQSQDATRMLERV
jgi:hypothetical protein